MTTLRTAICKGTLWSLAIAAALGSLSPVLRGEPIDLLENPSAGFHSSARDPRSLTDLPAQVQAADGKLTLWADYTSADQTSVPLYLVNRTTEAISLGTQDSDLGIKLEFKSEGGAWTRAQAHLSSFCGNSYYPVELPAGHFFKLQGYRAAEGGQYPVRYAFYAKQGLISNTGKGLISPGDLAAVARDTITLQKMPHAIYAAFDAYSRVHAPPETLSECVAVLRVLPLFERNEALLDKVRTLRDSITKNPATAETQEALQAIDKVLSHQWPAESSATVSIAQFCKQRILDESNPQSSGLPELLAWKVIAEDAAGRLTREQEVSLEQLNQWKPVLAKAEQVVQRPDATPLMKATVSNILSSGRLVEPLVSDAQVIVWLKSSQKELQVLGARAMFRRHQVAQLLQFAWDLSPEAQISVLSVLSDAAWRRSHRDGNSPPSVPEEEKRYWTHCFRTQPLEAADWSSSGGSQMGDAVRLPLREYLLGEAKQGMASEKEFPLAKPRDAQLPNAVRLLDRFENAEDDSLLRDLAKHRGTGARISYNIATGEKIEETVPVIANEADAALKRREYEAQAKNR